MRMFMASIALLAGASVWSAAHAADEWGIANEKVAQIEVTVVDLVCTLKNDCPPKCGDGRRQLGLLTAEGKLLAAVKSATLFAGPIYDLLPYCGRKVFVDGLLIENPSMKVFMVQNLRDSADQKWRPTDVFETQWAAKNGKADEWFRADPLGKKTLEEDGVFGIKGLAPKK